MFNPILTRLLVKSMVSKAPGHMRVFDLRIFPTQLLESAIVASHGLRLALPFAFLLTVCLLCTQSAKAEPDDGVAAKIPLQPAEKSADQTHQQIAQRQLYQSLGQLIFFDTSLSKTGSQSCSTCHEPTKGFMDGRTNAAEGAVSLGDDDQSFGSRNTPAITYAALTPEFVRDSEGYLGGLFLDGRASNLEEQAVEPFINPLEMALPDHATLVEKVLNSTVYRPILEKLLGDSFAQDSSEILEVIKRSLATFQRGASFSSFDSKYDRFLAGKETLTAKEERGRSLFFSQLVNCSNCHLLNPANVAAAETFTNYRYHNIGIPENKHARELATDKSSFPDLGLYRHPEVTEETAKGKFKVPSLRNVAVTAPYMHNGVFQKLETAVHYYNQFIVNNRSTRTNPETGEAWAAPEVKENLSRELLRQGQPMDQQRQDAIVAFLKTLTDKRYEALLQ